MMLRDYQEDAIKALHEYWARASGNPCLEMPTGSGKSWVIAALCQRALLEYPGTRILMLTHVKELIQQNLEKLYTIWPTAPVGVFAAGLKKKQAGYSLTFGSVQTVQNNLDVIGHHDLIVVDECHMISHKNQGGYRKIIDSINPHSVVGLTASPFRLGHGYITDGDAIFDEILKTVSIEELVARGFLAPIRNKNTDHKLNTAGVNKSGGDYTISSLDRAVNTDLDNRAAVDETIARAGDRKAWLFFCTGVDHANEIARLLNERGIKAAALTGKTSTSERDEIIRQFKAGELRALTNCEVLTTGFDYPDIDLIVALRPTLSPIIYVQALGRGMRPKSHGGDCRLLDFAGWVATHGPITAVRPRKKRKSNGEAPLKTCDNCGELLHASVRICPDCGTVLFELKPKTFRYDDTVDVMGRIEPERAAVTDWRVMVHKSAATGIKTLKIRYRVGFKFISEYLCILHDGENGRKAIQTLYDIASSTGSHIAPCETIEEIALLLDQAQPPAIIEYIKRGRFYDIVKRDWTDGQQNTAARSGNLISARRKYRTA